MKIRATLTVVALLAWSSVGEADIIGMDGAGDGGGAVVCTVAASYSGTSGQLTFSGRSPGQAAISSERFSRIPRQIPPSTISIQSPTTRPSPGADTSSITPCLVRQASPAVLFPLQLRR